MGALVVGPDYAEFTGILSFPTDGIAVPRSYQVRTKPFPATIRGSFFALGFVMELTSLQ